MDRNKFGNRLADVGFVLSIITAVFGLLLKVDGALLLFPLAASLVLIGLYMGVRYNGLETIIYIVGSVTFVGCTLLSVLYRNDEVPAEYKARTDIAQFAGIVLIVLSIIIYDVRRRKERRT
jgi:hypothetical protein